MHINMYSREKIVRIMGYSIINIFIIGILFTIIKNIHLNDWILPYIIISMIQLFISVQFLNKMGEDLFSLSILFLTLSYLFHFGQLILFAFNIRNNSDYDVVRWIPIDTLKIACVFASITLFFVTLGIGIVWIKARYISYNNKKNIDEYNLKRIYKIGLLMFIISIIPKLYMEISRLIVYISGDYLDTYSVLNFSGGGILVTFANMFEYGIIMIIIGLQKSKRQCKFIIFAILIFEIMTMSTGNRGRAIVNVLMFIYIYIRLIENIKFRHILLSIPIIHIFISLITFISQNRMDTNIVSNISKFTETFFKRSPFYDALAEFGSTMLTLCYSMLAFPEYGKPTYGINYLIGFANILPNINGILDGIGDKFAYTIAFKDYFSVRMALGGSYIGELFYNFSYIGVFFAIIIGMFVGTISKNINYSIEEKNWIRLSILIILFPSVLWFVRDYFSSIPRQFIWTSITIWFFSLFIKNTKDNNRSNFPRGFKENKGGLYN